MIEKNKSHPSNRIVHWSGQEVPGTTQTKVQKYGTKYQKMGPNTNLIFSIDQ